MDDAVFSHLTQCHLNSYIMIVCGMKSKFILYNYIESSSCRFCPHESILVFQDTGISSCLQQFQFYLKNFNKIGKIFTGFLIFVCIHVYTVIETWMMLHVFQPEKNTQKHLWNTNKRVNYRLTIKSEMQLVKRRLMSSQHSFDGLCFSIIKT